MDKLKLRPYQEEIVERAREAVRGGKRRILVQIPTGAGKTAVAIGIMQSAFQKGFRSIFFAHRRELVDQTVARFERYGIKPRILMAGRELENWENNDIIVASYQTYERRMGYLDGEYDVVFFDEAHIGVGRQQRVLEHILHWRPNAVIIGLTATPMTNSGPGLGSVYEHLIQGPKLEELIEQGYLVEPKFFVMQEIDPDAVFRIARDGEYDSSDVFEWLRQPKIIGHIIDNYASNFMGERFIVFANSIPMSVWIAEQFGNAGIPVAHIDYATPDKVRKRIIEDYKNGKILGISNVDILSEGFDVPDMSVIILAAPTRSLVRYIQRSGRALRPAQGKKHAYIVDHSGTLRRFGTLYNYQEWELEPARPNRRNPIHATKLKKPAKERICPVCHALLKPSARVCDNCGFDFYRLPKSQQPILVPAVMVEYERYIEQMRRGTLSTCTPVKSWPIGMDNYKFMAEILGWIKERRDNGKDTSWALADIIYYATRCECPHREGVFRRSIDPVPPSDFTKRMIKRFFTLRSQGYFEWEGGFPCWRRKR